MSPQDGVDPIEGLGGDWYVRVSAFGSSHGWESVAVVHPQRVEGRARLPALANRNIRSTAISYAGATSRG
ncbi:hypothetical protein [Nitrobacter sp.]|uniref:hypothetical protein n=1 Tax=Nitrobacter sp. TaxID=29420 RepID=UPI003F64C044